MKNQQRAQSIGDFIRSQKEPKRQQKQPKRQAWGSPQPRHLSDEDAIQRAIDASKVSYLEEKHKESEKQNLTVREEVDIADAISLSLEAARTAEAFTWTEVRKIKNVK